MFIINEDNIPYLLYIEGLHKENVRAIQLTQFI